MEQFQARESFLKRIRIARGAQASESIAFASALNVQPVSGNQKNAPQGCHPRLNRPDACQVQRSRIDSLMLMIMCEPVIVLVIMLL